MARSIVIGGTDYYPKYVGGSLDVRLPMTFARATAKLNVQADAAPAWGSEIDIADLDGSAMFSGLVQSTKLLDNDLHVWEIQAHDWTANMDRRLVTGVYENTPADEILLDLFATYLPDWDTSGIRGPAPNVEKLVLDHLPFSEALTRVVQYVGWHWRCDVAAQRRVLVFPVDTATAPAPLVLVDGGPFSGLEVDVQGEGVRNRIYVRGGNLIADTPYVSYAKADGTAREWLLAYKPHDLEVKVGGVTKTVGVDNLDDEALFDYMMDYQQARVRCSEQTATPAAGVYLQFTYRYEVPCTAVVEDTASQAAIAAIQGGDGVYEHLIEDKKLDSLDAAVAAAEAELREWANPLVGVNFHTLVRGWAPGQLVTVNLPSRGADTDYLVQELTLTWPTPQHTNTQVRAGGTILGVADFLKGLAEAVRPELSDTEVVLLNAYRAASATVQLSDSISRTTAAAAQALVDVALVGFSEVA